ncbi:unnamed protein product [Angiostrongylus costaricensis]|uniref:G_PROTEIN_RECEP_F1_2 domain-containing protein n=1 Tax=Angiostrongylus costaricensis TaxID=334426 RepID=A0A158PEK3_ANGCS|nr:unnamed protein product [Angiostrongylus costaricensis]
MVSPALEVMSPTNSLIRRIRRADAVGRFRARHDGYAWLFGQIHVKHLLLVTHIVFLIISLWLMWQIGVADFTGLQIPGLDGFSPFDLHHQFQFDHAQEWESIYVSTSPNIQKPYLNVSRNVASALSYLFFFSALMGFMVLSSMHGAWQRGVLVSLFRINLAFFLIPLLFCVVTLGAGFLLCCIRSFRMQLQQISESRTDQAVTFLIIDAIRFTFLPCAVMWIVYLYYVYGCVLSFLYVYRHSSDWSSLKRDIAATRGSVTAEKKACDKEVITHHPVTCCLEIGRYPSTETGALQRIPIHYMRTWSREYSFKWRTGVETHFFEKMFVVVNLHIEVLFAVLVFNGIVVATWRLLKLNMSSMSFILAVLSVIILALFIVAEMVLHIATVIYVCRRYDFKRTMSVQDIDFAVKSELNKNLTAALPAKLKYKYDCMSLLSSIEDSSKFSRISRQSPGMPVSSSNYARLRSSFLSSADRTYLSDYDALQSVFKPNDSNWSDRSSNFNSITYAIPSTCRRAQEDNHCFNLYG